MGAASKLDPTRIRVASIWESERCHLARLVRKRLRRRGFDGDFRCVYSDEPARGEGMDGAEAGDPTKARVNGSLVHVTATFGLVLAGLVVQDMAQEVGPPVAKGAETP